MKKFLSVLVTAAIVLALGVGLGNAVGKCGNMSVGGTGDAKCIAFADSSNTLATTTNSTPYDSGLGKTNYFQCTATRTGTNLIDVWMQWAPDTGASVFYNAHTTAWVTDPGDSDSLSFTGEVMAGAAWRVHIQDTDANATNTVSALDCYFWVQK